VFTVFDSLILVVYLIIVLSLGLYHSRKKDNSSNEYFLAGRSLGWVTIGLSIFATNISAEHFIGLAGSGASRGLAVSQFELMAIFILFILGWFLAPLYLKSNVLSMPELLGKRFDERSRKFFAGISIFMYFFTKISVTLFAGGLLFYSLFGLNIFASAIIIVLITGIYSVIGGASAVMKTHLFQAAVLLLGAALLTIFSLNEVGGYSGLREKLPDEFFNMFKSADDPDYPWTGIIFGAPIIAFWYWCTDQYIVQRILSANNINNARRGSLLAAGLKILPIFILVLPGLASAALFPEISGDEAYAALLSGDILPAGVKGIVVAGVLAAIMSSLSSVFSATATIYTNDFYKPRHPEANDRKLVLIGRLSTTAIVVAAILCVPLVKLISSEMYLYLQSVQGYLSPPITAVFLFGLFSRKVTAAGAIWTLILGEIIGFSRLAIQLIYEMNIISSPFIDYVVGINFLHFAVYLFVFCSAAIVIISFVTRKEKKVLSRSFYSINESLSEIKLNITNFGSVSGYKVNLLFSAVILLLILSLWSLWS
jgi:solute:Na+ symporter, SSS family